MIAANGVADVRKNQKFKLWLGNFSQRTVELPKHMRVALAGPPPLYTADASSTSNTMGFKKHLSSEDSPTSEPPTTRTERFRAQKMERNKQRSPRQRTHDTTPGKEPHKYCSHVNPVSKYLQQRGSVGRTRTSPNI